MLPVPDDADGKLFLAEVHASLLRDYRGLIATLAIFYDMTNENLRAALHPDMNY